MDRSRASCSSPSCSSWSPSSRWRSSPAVGKPPNPAPGDVTAVVARIRAIPSWQVTLGFALLALGFLIAAQLAAEGPRIRYTTPRRSPPVQTAPGLQTHKEQRKKQILDLRAQIK